MSFSVSLQTYILTEAQILNKKIKYIKKIGQKCLRFEKTMVQFSRLPER